MGDRKKRNFFPFWIRLFQAVEQIEAILNYRNDRKLFQFLEDIPSYI